MSVPSVYADADVLYQRCDVDDDSIAAIIRQASRHIHEGMKSPKMGEFE